MRTIGLIWEEGLLLKTTILVIKCLFVCCNHAVYFCVGVQKWVLEYISTAILTRAVTSKG